MELLIKARWLISSDFKVVKNPFIVVKGDRIVQIYKKDEIPYTVVSLLAFFFNLFANI